MEVWIYQDNNGRSPFSEWLKSLQDVNGRAIIRARINRLRINNFGDTRSIGSGISELRIHFGPGYRLYLARGSKDAILLLCGGTKSSQRKDIVLAKAYWADYKENR